MADPVINTNWLPKYSWDYENKTNISVEDSVKGTPTPTQPEPEPLEPGQWDKVIKKYRHVGESELNIRSEHSTQASVEGQVRGDVLISVYEIYNGDDYEWFRIRYGVVEGWVANVPGEWELYEEGNIIYRDDPEEGASEDTDSQDYLKNDELESQIKSVNEELYDLGDSTNIEYYNELFAERTNYSSQSFHSIIGFPFQFIPSADIRLGQSKFGRLFTENILFDMPIMTINPGGPKFLAGNSSLTDKEREGLTTLISNAAVGAVEDTLGKIGEILNGKWARYYGFQSNFTAYMKYVNTLCRVAANFLGINDLVFNGMKYRNFDADPEKIETDGAQGIKTLLGLNRAIHVYYQPNSNESESSSTQTKQSLLANSINGVSSAAKEAEFLFGVGAGIDLMSQTNAEQKIASMAKIGGQNSNNIFTRIMSKGAESFQTVLSGNNLIFPEIWSDSSFSKSYTLDIKLASPYGSDEAIFLYVLKPLFHLLALAIPRQLGPNGYTSPFLIQAHSKGMFNCELGIVESISIRRAGNGGDQQTINNLPTEVEVSMTIKDLYSNLSLTNLEGIRGMDLLANNIGLLDFIASFTGYNLNKPDLLRKFELFKDTLFNTYNVTGTIVPNIKSSIQDAARDVWLNLTSFVRN